MRSLTLPTVLAALALGASGLLYLELREVRRDLRGLRAPPPARQVEQAADATGWADAGGDAWRRERPPEEKRVPAPTLERAVGARTIEERVARLERSAAQRASPAPWHGGKRFARSVDDLERELGLQAAQRSRIEVAIETGRRRIDDLLRIPDETGKSPQEQKAEARRKIQEAMKNPQPGAVLAFTADLLSYRERRIPGRAETYGQAVDRIKKETREEIATSLDAQQAEAFGDVSVDGLLGETGQMSFAIAAGKDGEGEGMILEVGTTVTELEPTDTEPPPEPPPGR
jgi:hypothetical protein